MAFPVWESLQLVSEPTILGYSSMLMAEAGGGSNLLEQQIQAFMDRSNRKLQHMEEWYQNRFRTIHSSRNQYEVQRLESEQRVSGDSYVPHQYSGGNSSFYRDSYDDFYGGFANPTNGGWNYLDPPTNAHSYVPYAYHFDGSYQGSDFIQLGDGSVVLVSATGTFPTLRDQPTMSTRFKKNRKKRGYLGACCGRIRKHKKHHGGRVNIGEMKHQRILFDKYHLDYFGKVSTQYLHKGMNVSERERAGMSSLQNDIAEEAILEEKEEDSVVYDDCPLMEIKDKKEGKNGDQLFEKSPQKDETGGDGLGSARRNEKNSYVKMGSIDCEGIEDQVFDKCSQRTIQTFQEYLIPTCGLENEDRVIINDLELVRGCLENNKLTKLNAYEFPFIGTTDGDRKVIAHEDEETFENSTEVLVEVTSFNELERIYRPFTTIITKERNLIPHHVILSPDFSFRAAVCSNFAVDVGKNFDGKDDFDTQGTTRFNELQFALDSKSLLFGGVCHLVELITRKFDGLKALKECDEAKGVTKGTKLFGTVVSKMFESLNAAYQGHDHIMTLLLEDCSYGSLQFADSNRNIIVADIGQDLVYSAITAILVGKLVAAYLIAHNISLLKFVKQPEMQHKNCLSVSQCNEPKMRRMAWLIFHIPWVPETNVLWLCIMAFQVLLTEMFLFLVDPGDAMRLNQFQKALSFQLGAFTLVIPGYFRMKITSNATVTILEADKVKRIAQGQFESDVQHILNFMLPDILESLHLIGKCESLNSWFEYPVFNETYATKVMRELVYGASRIWKYKDLNAMVSTPYLDDYVKRAIKESGNNYGFVYWTIGKIMAVSLTKDDNNIATLLFYGLQQKLSESISVFDGDNFGELILVDSRSMENMGICRLKREHTRALYHFQIQLDGHLVNAFLLDSGDTNILEVSGLILLRIWWQGMSSPKALLYIRIFEFGQSWQNMIVFIVIFSCESSIPYELATSVLALAIGQGFIQLYATVLPVSGGMSQHLKVYQFGSIHIGGVAWKAWICRDFSILVVAYLLLRCGVTLTMMPVNFSILLLGVGCGLAWKFWIDTLGVLASCRESIPWCVVSGLCIGLSILGIYTEFYNCGRCGYKIQNLEDKVLKGDRLLQMQPPEYLQSFPQLHFSPKDYSSFYFYP